MNDGEGLLPELQQQYRAGTPARQARFPDLDWAERIVEKNIRGAGVSTSSLPLKMAREALSNHRRLEEVETRIRDGIAAERAATTVAPRMSCGAEGYHSTHLETAQ